MTPRTDAVMTNPLRDGNDLPDLARTLERELADKLAYIDLMVDEFIRIKSSFGSRGDDSIEAKNIISLCERAISNTYQREPVITQRDKALARAKQAELELADMRSVNRYHRGHTEGYKEAKDKYDAELASSLEQIAELKNAGGLAYLRSDAIQNCRDEVADLKVRLAGVQGSNAALEEDRDALAEERDHLVLTLQTIRQKAQQIVDLHRVNIEIECCSVTEEESSQLATEILTAIKEVSP